MSVAAPAATPAHPARGAGGTCRDRTVRVRLTLLYGGLFLLSGAALMAITYALLVNAGFVFSLRTARHQPDTAVVDRRRAQPAAPPIAG